MIDKVDLTTTDFDVTWPLTSVKCHGAQVSTWSIMLNLKYKPTTIS